MRKLLIILIFFGLSLPAQAAQDKLGEKLDTSAFPEGGVFAEVNIGIFMTFGGYKKAVSSISPFTGFTWGYNLNRNLGLSLNYGFGTSDAPPSKKFHGIDGGAPYHKLKSSGDTAGNAADFRYKYQVNFFDLGFHYKHLLSRRWALFGRAFAGIAHVYPDPSRVSKGQSDMNPTVGLNIGTEYFTILNHLVLGANLSTYYILGLGNGVPAIAVYPSVKYFF